MPHDDEQWARRVVGIQRAPVAVFCCARKAGAGEQDGAFGYIPAAWKALERSGAPGLRIYV